MDNLIKRYEDRLAKERDDRTAVYILSEIYSGTHKNPQRAIELLEQLAKLEAAENTPAEGRKATAPTAAMSTKAAREKGNLARQYVQAKQYRQAAQIYEEIAPLDPATCAWNTKEAAAAWLKDGNREQALRLALQADQGPPEARNDQLAHFFHRNLADILMAVGRARPGRSSLSDRSGKDSYRRLCKRDPSVARRGPKGGIENEQPPKEEASQAATRWRRSLGVRTDPVQLPRCTCFFLVAVTADNKTKALADFRRLYEDLHAKVFASLESRIAAFLKKLRGMQLLACGPPRQTWDY